MRVPHGEKRDVTTERSGRDPKGGGLCKKTKRRSRPQGRSGPQRVVFAKDQGGWSLQKDHRGGHDRQGGHDKTTKEKVAASEGGRDKMTRKGGRGKQDKTKEISTIKTNAGEVSTVKMEPKEILKGGDQPKRWVSEIKDV